jgi:hypothetical protein
MKKGHMSNSGYESQIQFKGNLKRIQSNAKKKTHIIIGIIIGERSPHANSLNRALLNGCKLCTRRRQQPRRRWLQLQQQQSQKSGAGLVSRPAQVLLRLVTVHGDDDFTEEKV